MGFKHYPFPRASLLNTLFRETARTACLDSRCKLAMEFLMKKFIS